jgi:hypothetical protein
MKEETTPVINFQYVPKEQNEEDIFISLLDPLDADAVLKTLPEMNAFRDIDSIICAIKNLMPDIEEIGDYSFQQALAVVRDLGMLAGSVKKHGLEPTQAVPSLEPVLLKLGQITDMPPRDTLLHYSVWNPDEERRRTYTGCRDENRLIESAKMAVPRLEKAINELTVLHELSLASTDFLVHCQQCNEDITGMVEAVLYVKQNVSPKVFGEELRPYYDAIEVQGKKYLGPGAVEMPLFVFDHLLWGTECREEIYVEFKKTFFPYWLPAFRQLYVVFENKPSLLTKVCQELKDAKTVNSSVLAGANTLVKIFTTLLGFRHPHKKIVNEVYVQAEKKLREQGSGGYTPEVLVSLTVLTSNARKELIKNIHHYKSELSR